MKRTYLLLMFTVLICGCTKEPSAFSGMDLSGWRQDRDGCAGKRTLMIDEVSSRRKELLGLSENEVLDLLGKPDENQLYSHNQKFYHYFLEPSQACTGGTVNARRLIIRFSAIGISSEVSVE